MEEIKIKTSLREWVKWIEYQNEILEKFQFLIKDLNGFVVGDFSIVTFNINSEFSNTAEFSLLGENFRLRLKFMPQADNNSGFVRACFVILENIDEFKKIIRAEKIIKFDNLINLKLINEEGEYFTSWMPNDNLKENIEDVLGHILNSALNLIII